MRRRILTIALAVLLAIAGTGAVLVYVRQADTRALAGQAAVRVLVAQQQIPAGTSASSALQTGLLQAQTLPASSVPPNALRSVTPDISGLVLSAAVQPGQLLLRPMLVTTAQAAGSGALAIPKGLVAVTIAVCLPQAVAGYVQPGSSVAVFDTYGNKNLQASETCNSSGVSQSAQVTGGAHTRIVLPRALVVSMGAAQPGAPAAATATSGSGSASSSGAVLVTMAVSQANAERLILLTETGLPYLALLTPSSHTGFDVGVQSLFTP